MNNQVMNVGRNSQFTCRHCGAAVSAKGRIHTSCAAKRTITPPEVRARIDAAFLKNADRLGYLQSRWADESEHEDWTEYIDALMMLVPEGGKVLSTSKRPFGITFSMDGVVGAMYSFRATSNGVQWTRTK